ncbi:MAG: hypothetical protein HYU98_06480 [Deltaproteobacteria bacterium]|nr:hypothetical protein [Deltaproteobacteria bacterium]
MPDNEKPVNIMKPLDPWAPLTQECIDLIEKIPESCGKGPADKTGRPYVDYFERCQKPIDEAAKCLETNSAAKCLPAGSRWSSELPKFLNPYFKLAEMLKDPIKKLGLDEAFSLASALRSVFLISVARCEPALIESVVKFISNLNFLEVEKLAGYLEKTQWTDLTKRLGVGFSNKAATLLLVKVFALQNPAKSSDELLDMAFNYFPPEPLGPVKY